MPTRVTDTADLVDLQTWLLSMAPDSLLVSGLLRSKLLGKLDCDVVVNSLRHPSVVLIKLGKRQGLFTTNVEHLSEFLTADEVLDWTAASVFTGVAIGLTSVLQDIATRYNGRMDMGGPSHFAVSNRPSKDSSRSLPSHCHLRSLCQQNVEKIVREWKFSNANSIAYITWLVKMFPCIGVVDTQSGQLIAWGLTQHYGAIGMLHVLPEYRRRGLGEIVVRTLVEDIRQLGYRPYACIERENLASVQLFEKCGFEVTEGSFVWIRYGGQSPSV